MSVEEAGVNPTDREKRAENWKQMSAGFNAIENKQISAYAAVVIRHDDPKPYYGFFAGDSLEDAKKLLVKVDMIKSFLMWLIERARLHQGKLATTTESKQTLPWLEENMNPMWTEEEKEALCGKGCLYMSPKSDRPDKEWCALKGAHVEAGQRCKDYKLRKEVKRMPHYKDGQAAQVGDTLKTKEGLVGKVIQVTPGCESCNAAIACVDVVSPEKVYHGVNVQTYTTSEGLKLVHTAIRTVTLGECEKVA